MLRCSVGLAYILVSPPTFFTYHPLWLRHPDGFHIFGVPNPGKPQISYSGFLGGGHPGGLSHALKGRRFLPWFKSVAKARPRRTRCLSGVSLSRMYGRWVAGWRHCLGVFWSGRYRCWRTQEFWAHWCGWRSPLFRQWLWSSLTRPRTSFSVFWYVPQGLAWCPRSWASFCLTQHI